MVSDSNVSYSTDICLGSRIECGDKYGTVRYIGELDGLSSTWLGIDWDDSTRGKHDGVVAGKRYFQASSETSASFVRCGKVRTGINAVEAIISRYGKKEDKTAEQIHQLELLNLQKEINAPFLTMVGFDKVHEKQSNFQGLHVVSLRMQYVNGPGPEGELSQICPNIFELDLSKNLISSWTAVFRICQQLKNLRWLSLSENLLEMPENLDGISFPTVTTLICGYMKLNWNDILKISAVFPNLLELRVPFNSITNIEIPTDHTFQSLNLLDLEGNCIKDWSEFNKLGVLTTLDQLNVANTCIQTIKLPECLPDEKLPIFVKLEHLVVSENLINNWESINELNKLQCLGDLKFLKNPILETENAATCFQLTIARISTLYILNGTIISNVDRKGAEYDYIKKHGLEWLEVSKNEELKNIFLEKHPRYIELITKYGEPEESELIVKSQSLKTSLTSVQIQYGEKVLSKKLPATMTLQKLIMLVQKVFNLSERPMLYYVNSKFPDMEIEMNDEFKEIGYYSLQNGDRIFIK